METVNFKTINRKSLRIYDDLAEAKKMITTEASKEAEDAEMVIARYKDGDKVKSVIGIYHDNTDDETTIKGWTIRSYDDDDIDEKLTVTYDEDTKTLIFGF